MEGQEGVIETPTEAPVEEATPAPETQVASKSENRYQKLANENRSLKEQSAKVAEYEKQIDALKDAKQLDAWLRADSKNARAFLKLMDELNAPQTPSNDPDEEYFKQLSSVDPRAAEILRQAKMTRQELQELRQQQERERNENLQKSTEEIQQTRDAEYDDFLEKNGYTKEGKDVDKTLNDGFSKLNLAWLAQNAKDWKRPSVQEMKDACDYAHSIVTAGKRLGMKSTVKAPGVPPSGSKQGGIHLSKGKDTDASRQSRMLAALN